MEPTRILAIRHGETAWNVDTRLQGHLDIPLNDEGLRQAQHLAQALGQSETIDAIYASDLSRAHITAQAIAQATGHTVSTHPGLKAALRRFSGTYFCRDRSRAARTRLALAQTHTRLGTAGWW